MKNKRILTILCFVLMLTFIGCGKKQTRVITNDKKICIENSSNDSNEDQKDKTQRQDMSIYKGYEGPVQGEIKYKEGRPASQNSKTRKATHDIGSPYHVDLIVTKDFGHTKMYGKNVGLVKDEVGMEVLFRNLDIQTAYGGGFVNAINGLESKYTFYSGSEREKKDWFYWVNGILAPIGVAEYRPAPGDVIWWDYHEWNTTMFIPAIIGSYPEPFKHGFGGKNPGTVIMYTDGFKSEAENLKKSLIEKEVKKIDIVEYDPSIIEKPDKYCILIGKWNQLSKNSKRLKKMNWRNKLEGVYIEFKDEKLNALGNTGKVIKSFDDAGAVYAASSGMGSIIPVWLITGNTNESVKKALNILINKSNSIKNCFEIVVTGDQIIQVPFVQ